MDADLVRRVEYLENTVESLRDLPERTTKLEARMGAVEMQIVQLRVDMHGEFSAIRAEMATKEELRNGLDTLRWELRDDIAALGRDVAARFLESERLMRLLIEDVIARIAALVEGGR
jgi:hypothetical protein